MKMLPFPDKIHHWVYFHTRHNSESRKESFYYCRNCSSLGTMGFEGYMNVKNGHFGSATSCDDMLVEKLLNE